MKKKWIGLIILSLTACQSHMLPLQKVNQLSAFKQQSSWYERLSPELQRYYITAKGKVGRPLLEALHLKINQAKTLNYGEASAFLYQRAERVTGQQATLRAAYSNVLITGDGPSGHKYKEKGDANADGKKGDSINTEHTWPQSFFGKQGAMRSDLHHLFPTLSTPNSKRGHHAFGMASEGNIVYSTKSGSHLVKLSNGDAVFEVDHTQKGNTSRAILYFHLRYFNRNIRQGDYHARTFFMKRIPLFKTWMQQDPVDSHELKRHQLIAEKQGNRNPFIDIPDLMDLIGIDIVVQLERRLNP